ncbi:MAG: amino acid ABC transporter permease [Clostridiales bacterium]|nr:amino acid ABC transporter permease [Clostridiales bacterium]
MLGCKQSFLFGIKLTIVLTAAAVTTGLILAVFLALGKISKLKILSKICSGYIFFFRGTPLLIQLFVVYLAIPNMIPGFSWRMAALKLMPSVGSEAVFYGAFVAAYIAFSLNSAAYCAEIVRAAIQSIDKGQHEAAKALGLTYGQTMSKIVIPQSLGRLIPPVANEFIMVLKDASLVFAISLQDITTITQTIATNEASFTVFIPALVLFLCITAFFTMVFNKLERYFSKYN